MSAVSQQGQLIQISIALTSLPLYLLEFFHLFLIRVSQPKLRNNMLDVVTTYVNRQVGYFRVEVFKDFCQDISEYRYRL